MLWYYTMNRDSSNIHYDSLKALLQERTTLQRSIKGTPGGKQHISWFLDSQLILHVFCWNNIFLKSPRGRPLQNQVSSKLNEFTRDLGAAALSDSLRFPLYDTGSIYPSCSLVHLCLRNNISRTLFFLSYYLFLFPPSFYHPLLLYHVSRLREKSAMDVLVWMWLCAVMDASRSRVLSWILKRQMGVETEWDGNAMQL